MVIDWDTIDWGPSLPGKKDIVRSWGRVRFDRIPQASLLTPAVERLLREYTAVYPDPPVFAGFQVFADDPVTRWFATRDRLNEMRFFSQFLGSTEVRAALPELAIPVRLPTVRTAGHDHGGVPLDLGFQRAGPGALCLDGLLAGMLVAGGTLEGYTGTYAEAKQLGREASDELVGDRYIDFRIYHSTVAWAGYFEGRSDDTWILIDRPTARLLLLCFTDYD